MLNWKSLAQVAEPVTAVDPFSGYGTIPWALEHHAAQQGVQLTCVTNDIAAHQPAQFHLDALAPSFWEQLFPEEDPHIIVSSPPFELLDALAPDLVQRSRVLTALHVPGDYLTNGGQIRRCWWSELQRQGRTAIIQGLPPCPGRPVRRCVGLLVFNNAHYKRLLWQSTLDTVTLTCR